MTVKDAVTWASVAVQLVAAGLWFWSAKVKVTPEEVERQAAAAPDFDGWLPASMSVGGAEVGATMVEAAKWSRWAALATGVGIGLQALALALPAPPG